MSIFQKAVKSAQKLKLLLQGASGSGKTYSALILATEIAKSTGKRIAFIDSENGSASLYADKFDFDVMELKDYSVNSYITAFNQAKISDDHSVVILDSITQEWEWVLDQVSASTKGYPLNWKQPSELHSQFLKAILMFNKHLICTVRAKQDYSINEQKKVQKLGLAPVQREGIEYEFTTAFMIDENNKATATKDRTSLFKNAGLFKINEATGKTFLDWLNNAPVQEQLDILQIAKETLQSKTPEQYIEYINNDSEIKKISNAELVLELKKYAFDKAKEQGYELINGKFQKEADLDTESNNEFVIDKSNLALI
jgi:AAA domain